MAKKYKGYKGAGMRRTKTQLSEQSRQLLRQALTNAMQSTVRPLFLPLTEPLVEQKKALKERESLEKQDS